MAVAATASVLLTGGAVAAGYHAAREKRGSSGSSSDGREVAVFFCIPSSTTAACGHRAATEQEKQAAMRRLQAMPKVRSVAYESQTEAYERFKQQFKDRKDLLEATRPDAIPDSLRVRVADAKAAESVKGAMGGVPGVDEVVVQPERART